MEKEKGKKFEGTTAKMGYNEFKIREAEWIGVERKAEAMVL